MRYMILSATVLIGLLISGAAGAATGGPDEFGYTWTDEVAFQWVDATGGQTVPFAEEDALRGPLSLGFSFDFYGKTYDQVYVSSNGRLVFVDQQETFRIPCIPSEAPYVGYVALYWDDLDPVTAGTVYVYHFGEAPRRFFVVEFSGVRHWNSADDAVTAQVVLVEETSDVVLQYLDPSTEAGQYATVGMMSWDGDAGLSILCQQPVLAAEKIFVIRHPAFVDLQVRDSDLAAAPGGSAAFELTARNATNGPADIAFTWEGALWPISVTPGQPSLDPGEITAVTVQVDVPGDAWLWQTDSFVFSAFAVGNVDAAGSVTLSAVAGPDWQPLAEALPAGFQDHAVVSDGEWIYVLSNYLAPGITGDFVRFNLDGDTETLPTLDPAINVTDGVFLWNKLVFLGGVDENGDVSDQMSVWDLHDEAWGDDLRLPAPTAWAATVVLEDELYVIGGFDGQGVLDEVWVFDPGHVQWRRAAPLLAARERPLAGAIDGKIIVVGGTDIVPVRTAEIYDPATDTWTSITPPPRVLSGAADCTCNGRFYVIGGRENDHGSDAVYEYDPALDLWTPVSRLQSGRFFTEADLLAGRIVVAGGMGQLFEPIDDAESLFLDCADEIVPGDRDFGTADDDDDTTPDADDEKDDPGEASCCGCGS